MAVEFRDRSWHAGDALERTAQFLQSLGIVLVTVDDLAHEVYKGSYNTAARAEAGSDSVSNVVGKGVTAGSRNPGTEVGGEGLQRTEDERSADGREDVGYSSKGGDDSSGDMGREVGVVVAKRGSVSGRVAEGVWEGLVGAGGKEVLPIIVRATNPEAGLYVRLHRREGCERVLSDEEMSAWAERFKGLIDGEIGGVGGAIKGTVWFLIGTVSSYFVLHAGLCLAAYSQNSALHLFFFHLKKSIFFANIF